MNANMSTTKIIMELIISSLRVCVVIFVNKPTKLADLIKRSTHRTFPLISSVFRAVQQKPPRGIIPRIE